MNAEHRTELKDSPRECPRSSPRDAAAAGAARSAPAATHCVLVRDDELRHLQAAEKDVAAHAIASAIKPAAVDEESKLSGQYGGRERAGASPSARCRCVRQGDKGRPVAWLQRLPSLVRA
jgi:hypothetical protein